MAEYDVVVAGIGGMGSAALAHCAARGKRVLGIEQFAPLHRFGASSGKSRIIRRAYFEDPAYVPLLERAYELWHALERETQTHLLHTDGLLTAGYETSAMVEGARSAVQRFDLAAEFWDAADIRARYPALNPEAEDVGIFEPEGGFVVPEAAVAAHMSSAIAHGAQLHFGVSMQTWECNRNGISVVLSDGTVMRCDRLILTLGPWFKATLESLGIPVRVQRNVQAWFTPKTALGPREMPTFLIERRDLPAPFYGFPDIGDGVKGAFHGLGAMTDAQHVDRTIDTSADVTPIAEALEAWIPGSAHVYRDAKACMYARTPDEHFVIDRHPDDERVVLCGGFSGHGFKFASAVGEIAAELALYGDTQHEIEFLSMRRFRKRAP